MTNYVPIIIDLLLVVLAGFFLYNGAKNGFARSVIYFAGYLGSLLVCVVASRFLATALFDALLRDRMVEQLNTAIGSQTTLEGVLTGVQQALAQLPGILSNALNAANIPIQDSVQQYWDAGAVDLAGSLVDRTVGPVIIGLLQSILFVVLFFICLFLVKHLANCFRFVNKIPLIGFVNKLFGGVIGLLTAGVFFVVVAMVLQLLISITGDGIPYLTTENINATYLFKWFYQL